MSFDRVPSRSEVMGWGPNHLADYLRKMNLSGSDKVVLKHSMNGSRFVNMSENDLQKFPKLHAPMISKLCNEISKKEERRGLFSKKPTVPKYPEPDAPVEDLGWGEGEFESDDDYEEPDDQGSVGDYESPTEDLDDRFGVNDNDYEPPPSEPPEDLSHKVYPTLPMGDSDYIDNRSRNLPPVVCPRPPAAPLSARLPVEPSPPRRDNSPHCGGRPPGKFPEPPQVFRDKKPSRDRGSNQSPIRGRNTVDRPPTHPWRPQPEAPEPSSWAKLPAPPPTTSVSRSNSSARPPPNRFGADLRNETHDEGAVPPARHHTFPLQNKGLPPRPGLPGPPVRQSDSLPPSIPTAGSLPHKLQAAISVHRSSSRAGPDRQSVRPAVACMPPTPTDTQHTQDLDPRWYVGKVTRGQAEGCLKQVNKDGAYLVRDSTRQLADQPFTLMVLYQDKVFNIQIRQQNQQYLLGTGLKVQECFPTVEEIINHYSHSPLLLIDAKNRGSGQQNQCLLSDPAGYWLGGQNWS
ncbi:lymphocyte cytosolic protein 2a [Myripristis murdjan]|uniref:Lymphocyte cytosolic protein 2 n=1 Tax=Myripristis murdjan TaxID=586833 RepID=A0A667YS78_9TELE|nr:lymphocyte cytosolic protein 2 [Myripristis murdjan]XP_029924220.1 lymphocyte cytosolic protein 2 [Myripristis murdjan]XP_029924222.1 lymphocyte cytosolic protein 2 [Myripristis murdjan]XP_029924223.1 lymphocyte cytosolic protein 2 [Myripristis murdjan]